VARELQTPPEIVDARRARPAIAALITVVLVLAMVIACSMPAVQSAREAPHASRRALTGDLASKSAEGLAPSAAGEGESRYAAAIPRVKGQFTNFQAPAIAPRRIIYDASMTIVVKKVSETEAEITKLLKQAGGYIAESNVDRTQGEELTGRWKVRIPVAKFDEFIEAVSKLGVAESRQQTAQDVTAEFVDLEAQIANKKRLEERIVGLLKDSSGQIKDVIEVERELARVRGEIEQMEGRLRYLTNRTDFTTVSISAREQENYVPPAAPTFTSRAALAWSTSIVSLREFGELTAIGAVYAFPWLAIFSVVAIPLLLLVRQRGAAIRKRARTEPSQS
jgi:uncharacterized coiled-coil protein SlyX